jgi:transcriptional regulator with XRE-family HTH domain
MSTIIDDVSKRLGARIKAEREQRGWSLTELAERSNVSRAMINNVERGVMSPTAALLGRLSGAFGLTMSTLLARAEGPQAARLLRAADQPLWQDPKSGYVRRHVAPGPGSDLPFDIVRVAMPPGGEVAFPAASYLFIRQVLWVLSGRLELVEGDQIHDLGPGDSLEFGGPRDCCYRNRGDQPCDYAVIVLRTT